MSLNIVLFDTNRCHRQLYPLSLTKAVSKIRHGLFTAQEWYGHFFAKEVTLLTTGYLQKTVAEADGDWLCIDASVIPNKRLAEQMITLQAGEVLEDENGIIAYVSHNFPVFNSFPLFFEKTIHSQPITRINHAMDFVKSNSEKITADISLLNTHNLSTIDLSQNKVFGTHKVYVEPGAKVQGCIFNTEEGPVFIGKNALLMEGSCFRGPVSIGEGAVVKMGSQIYGGTTIGKFCTAGGEIKNSILGDYSNKAHHGYLGDSIIGEWCNLGAGTSNSNVKNNAGMISMWNEETHSFALISKKAGVIMGDFCKTAINTSINSGTTIGVSCSLHHIGLTEKHIPSFSWGPGEAYKLNNVLTDIEQWHAFKNRQPEPELKTVIEYLYRNNQHS